VEFADIFMRNGVGFFVFKVNEGVYVSSRKKNPMLRSLDLVKSFYSILTLSKESELIKFILAH
jgi:hypothetical protein